ncbi:hypothetical protein [Roseateles sp. BYS87W]|uniref:Uncharacterized protein n=1 Tax=Pelomonas baiyunensis TaxID=3299026 RepID=A0ABW7H216_9BURK
MAASARFRFNLTLLGAVAAVVLTLFVPGDGDPPGGPVQTASLLPPPQR